MKGRVKVVLIWLGTLSSLERDKNRSVACFPGQSSRKSKVGLLLRRTGLCCSLLSAQGCRGASLVLFPPEPAHQRASPGFSLQNLGHQTVWKLPSGRYWGCGAQQRESRKAPTKERKKVWGKKRKMAPATSAIARSIPTGPCPSGDPLKLAIESLSPKIWVFFKELHLL